MPAEKGLVHQGTASPLDARHDMRCTVVGLALATSMQACAWPIRVPTAELDRRV
jgi:hypothetical protein